MDLEKLLQYYPEVNITIKAKDLFSFANQIAIRTANHILENKTEKVFTRDEVIKKFNISSSTLYRWTKNGFLKSNQIGNRTFYSETEIEKLIKRRN